MTDRATVQAVERDVVDVLSAINSSGVIVGRGWLESPDYYEGLALLLGESDSVDSDMLAAMLDRLDDMAASQEILISYLEELTQVLYAIQAFLLFISVVIVFRLIHRFFRWFI